MIAQFVTAVVDVADEFLVGFIDEFQAADEAFGFAVDVGNIAPHSGELFCVVAGGGDAEIMAGEKGAAIVAEDVVVEKSLRWSIRWPSGDARCASSSPASVDRYDL
ncbi:hypothetical protein [Nocardia sp. NPDC049149]|uniref:hypothetical protein n=1 Tax=Nocardia sp. NPDC049149 TaxID=3364315 RepID=UPI00371E245F